MLNRRALMAALAVAGFQLKDASSKPLGLDALRGAIDATQQGVAAGRAADQGPALSRVLRDAAARGMPVFLPPGDYAVSTLVLPDKTHLTGIAGATRLVFRGGGQFVTAEALERLTLAGLTFDGAALPLDSDGAQGLLTLRGIRDLTLEACAIDNAGGHGLHAEQCGGTIADNSISGAALAGIYAVGSIGLAIRDNRVSDCGNGGILVHRWEPGEDGTLVSGNRIARIGATKGGTGENGNGINLYRAANAIVSGNHISDCAFSAIRANAASDVQIADNQCLRSGETAIYSEFGFQGAVVSGNLIDGAANGILIVNFDEGGRLASVANNLVRNLKRDGPYIHDGAGFGFGIAAEADTVISGNVIENAPRFGLMLGWGPYMRNLVATGNLVRSAAAGCAVTVVEGAGTALIADNLFQDVTDGAILGYRWNDRATGDLTVSGSQAFAHLVLSGNRRVGG